MVLKRKVVNMFDYIIVPTARPYITLKDIYGYDISDILDYTGLTEVDIKNIGVSYIKNIIYVHTWNRRKIEILMEELYRRKRFLR